MKTPISYYGGKQNMVKKILPLIPPHKQYIEAFFGGGAVFFAKEKSEMESINDTNNNAIAFYKTCKNNFYELKKLIDESLQSEYLHKKAKSILLNETENELNKAWAFWYQCNFSFASQIFAGFCFDNVSNKAIKKMQSKKDNFIDEIMYRLENVTIFCRDALNLIKLKNKEDTFFYLDPPYFNANMGHYGGYTEQDFINLLDLLSNIKGKFLLSSYDSEILQEYIQRNNWLYKTYQYAINASENRANRRKTELLIYNYQIEDNHRKNAQRDCLLLETGELRSSFLNI